MEPNSKVGGAICTLVWGTFLLSLCTAAEAQGQLSSDVAALLSFKAEAVADLEGLLPTWAKRASVCRTWEGVECGLEGGVQRVVGLSLPQKTLAPVPLPSALGNLTALQRLDLSYAGFQGALPLFLKSLSKLVSLNLAFNSLNGSLPRDVLKSLSALEEVNLSFNSLEGSLPDELGLLTSLTRINLDGNSFTGGIPKSLGNLVNLVALSLIGNPLGGSVPATLGRLTRLETLSLSATSLTGTLEDLPLGNLTRLRHLQLSTNNFTGGFPSWLASLPALEDLDLNYNLRLTPGPLPSDAASWPKNLTSVVLSNTNLVGSIPQVLGHLPFLTTLNLQSNNLTGSIPKELGQLAAGGITLNLRENKLNGSIPWELGNCSYASLSLGFNALEGDTTAFVQTLCAKNSQSKFQLELLMNRLTGSLSSAIGTCSHLYALDVSSNAFTGAIPATLGQLQDLEGVFLKNNQFTGEVPPQLASLPNVINVDVSSNNLTGEIPKEFNCSMQSLSFFLAANNSLRGSIPRGLAGCPLQVLDLRSNELSGPIPRELYNASSLVTLQLSGNRLNGTLEQVLDWSILTELRLRENALQGSIPTSLGTKAGSLQVIDLGRNQLSGEVPDSLFSIRDLSSLDLSNNSLTGPLSPLIGNARSLTLLKLGGNQLNGTLPLNALRKVTQLQVLDVRDNNFAGRITVNNSGLVSILAAGNSFSGPVSDAFVHTPSLAELDLSRNSLNGTIPDLPTTLKLLNLSSNALAGPLPQSITDTLTLLESLDVSHNQLSGPIPAGFETLTRLQYLDLSANRFSSSLPSGLGTSPGLTYLNVSGNSLEGSIPAGLADFPSASFADNPGLCGKPLAASCPSIRAPYEGPQEEKAGIASGAIIGIAIALSLVVLLSLLALVGVRRALWGMPPRALALAPEGKLVVFQKLDFAIDIEDIVAATDGFSETHCLGRGGFGSVYRASLEDGKLEVAIKRLDSMGKQGEKEFLAEMATLGQIRHKNLVPLLAAYSDPVSQERLLIYRFLSGGDLWSALKQGIDWAARFNIALGIAEGLVYLHEHCSPAIIHLDIKPQNVLLDEKMQPYVADFGLAKPMAAKKTHVSTNPRGSFGYMAPEAVFRFQVSTKADVYAFGVVLVQLVTGRGAVDHKDPEMEEGLVKWAHDKQLAEVIDSRLAAAAEDPEAEVQMKGVLQLGLMCTNNKPEARESIKVVLHRLENLV